MTQKLNPNHVIGNTNGKKYYRIDCDYLDIVERNKKQFKNAEDAERDGYVACNSCNPKD
ncbi:MAG: hypothetical protein GXO65_01985 [Euryarchaeota archaeon]|nr:hypothetical protein [Euryarchaeota archaeon]